MTNIRPAVLLGAALIALSIGIASRAECVPLSIDQTSRWRHLLVLPGVVLSIPQSATG